MFFSPESNWQSSRSEIVADFFFSIEKKERESNRLFIYLLFVPAKKKMKGEGAKNLWRHKFRKVLYIMIETLNLLNNVYEAKSV